MDLTHSKNGTFGLGVQLPLLVKKASVQAA